MSTTPRERRSLLAGFALLAGASLIAASCSDDDDGVAGTTTVVSSSSVSSSSSSGPTTSAVASGSTTATTAASGVSAAGITDARCQANKDAGKITYVSSFDFAASASIVDVVVAKQKGYYEAMCLDVELKPGFSTQNYPLVASGEAEFSGAGSYTELVQNNANGAALVALVDYGKTAIEALLVPDDSPIHTVADVKGKTIGIKGALPPSLVSMLAKDGVKTGDFKEVLLEGFDPLAHLQTAIDALPVYKSNEPGQLDAAGIKYRLFDPLDDNIASTFGLLYTSQKFLADHPTAAEDFIRASLKGFADAVADPTEAVGYALGLINAAGNKNFLSDTGEAFRWSQEAKIVQDNTPSGEPIGLIDPALFRAEIAGMVIAGVFPSAPNLDGTYDADLAKGLYDARGVVIFPTK